MKTYEDIKKEAIAIGEKKDCAVRAVAAVSNLPYMYVHAMFAKHGRKPKRGTDKWVITNVLKELNIWVEQYTNYHARTIVTLGRELPKKGRFLVWVRGHILAAVDGEIVDWTKGRRHHIIGIEKVSF